MAKFATTSYGASGGEAWLKKPGTFHARVVKVEEPALAKKTQLPLNGFRVTFAVLSGKLDDGTDIGAEVGKQFDYLFFYPDSDKTPEQNLWPIKKITAFLVGAGLMNESAIGQDVDVELQHSINRQLVIQMAAGKDDFLDLHYSNIYHIDDPRVASIPRDQAALKLLPAQLRRDPKSFDLEKITGKASSASSSAGGSTNGQSRSMAGAGVGSKFDVDDV